MNRHASQPDADLQKTYRVRILAFLFAVLAFLVLFSTIVKGLNTIQRLEAVESERDQWQRAPDVIAALNLRKGDVVVDVGSGAGYFALKLSRTVGSSGEVIAVDVRKLPLTFLWIRAFFRGAHNVKTQLGDLDDPRLSTNTTDAVLISNTYHEFTNPELMLDYLSHSLRSGGRLVILDHLFAPQSNVDHAHGIPPGVVEGQLRKKKFDILERRDEFIVGPAGEQWWLVVARKPRPETARSRRSMQR